MSSKKNEKEVYVCQECQHTSPKWLGKCPECQQWNTFVTKENFSYKLNAFEGKLSENPPLKLDQINEIEIPRFSSQISEFDRVLGGGIVPGSLVLIGGEPGIGKSTLLMEVMGKLGGQGKKVLYVSGEESQAQVASRAKRLGVTNCDIYILHECFWQNVLIHLKNMRPDFLVLDSIQTTVSSDLDSPPGTVSQVREVTYEVMNHAKAFNLTCFIIGHVTKEGSLAGPKILEHMVDTVIYFEGDQLGHYRLLRVIKNRFGNVNEVGVFEMSELGLVEVKNPSLFFLEGTQEGSFGYCLTSILEGTRTLLVEIQALVVETKSGMGRRNTQGLDPNRLCMLVAILEKYFSVPLGFCDIFLNVVGGLKLTKRESDLSILVSLLSSIYSKKVLPSTIFLGEVGLTGEVRPIPQMEMRVKELTQLGYKTVITSNRTEFKWANKYPMEIIGISKAQELVKFLV